MVISVETHGSASACTVVIVETHGRASLQIVSVPIDQFVESFVNINQQLVVLKLI
jgi:hypothetical protein